MDVSQYLEIFLDETKEHLQNLNTQILELEQDSENMDTVNEIFRAAHSLKGMAGTMGYKRMQNLTHDMENVFSEVRNGNIKVQPGMIDILFQCLDALEGYLAAIQETSDEGTNDNENLIKALNDILNSKGGAVEAPAKEEAKEEAPAAEEAKEEAKSEAAAPAASGSKEKWQEIKLTDTEKDLYVKAKEEGQHFYGITVYIQESCILKAARAFLVFKALEDRGEILLSKPSTQDIEDERFDFDFSVIVVSKDSFDNIKEAIKSVSEIEDAFGRELTDADFGGSVETSEEKTEGAPEAKEETHVAAAPKA
ncbi:MAG: Hpt domain-containing protein, partial [Lachnospiraceae bacterium]|nr:Hpt domain-containing protein [Lachnospiraceae bacterium]